jgi:hypothetical protein
MLTDATTCYLSQSSCGWKIIASNGRTVARFRGPFAHRQALRYLRDLGRWSNQ